MTLEVVAAVSVDSPDPLAEAPQRIHPDPDFPCPVWRGPALGWGSFANLAAPADVAKVSSRLDRQIEHDPALDPAPIRQGQGDVTPAEEVYNVGGEPLRLPEFDVYGAGSAPVTGGALFAD